MSTGELEFRRANEADTDAVVAVLDEAARWHVAHGIEQWEPGSFGDDWIGPPLRRGWTYLVRSEDAIVGTVSLEEDDESMWPDGGGDALYVHRLAVRPPGSGGGRGSAILEWCAEQVRARGRRYLRLDCPYDNAPLRRYYERLGFVLRAEKTLSGDWGTYRAAKYEKAVAPELLARPLDHVRP